LAYITLSIFPTINNMVTEWITIQLVMMNSTNAPRSEDRTVTHVPDSNMVSGAKAREPVRIHVFQISVRHCSAYGLRRRAVGSIPPADKVLGHPPRRSVTRPDQINRVLAVVSLQWYDR